MNWVFLYILQDLNTMDDNGDHSIHRCSICGRLLATKASLKDHLLIHTGDKPYRFETCDKSFRRIDHLKRHQLIHIREKPYHCEVCDKIFSRLSLISANWKFRLASIAMPNSYLLDGMCNLHLTTIKDSNMPFPDDIYRKHCSCSYIIRWTFSHWNAVAPI